MCSAEIPGVKMVLADSTNYRRRPAMFPSYTEITIHCTDGHAAAMPVAEMWREPDHGSSAHLVVGQDGTVLQCVPLRCAAYHAHSANAYTVGIEHCARTPGELGKDDPGLAPSDALYAASARVVAYLLVAAGLPADRAHVRGHAEADPETTHTRCPDGCGWDWTKYMAMVGAEYDALVRKSGSGALVG